MPANLQKARELFLHVVGKLPPEEWDKYVADACSGDAELAHRVLRFLDVHREASSFLQSPAIVVESSATIDQPLSEKPGTVIGPYKLLEQIGEGGFGIVFMAEQLEPVRRRVALKVIKPGMDTRQIIARFEAERQALAVMDHPNIARVLDAGATGSGRPYFVMELVRGTPITQYCDESNLPIRERLELFASVCQAIQHAHTKGIIHRDIKPTNVLVTRQDGQAVVKVIDFGIAKAMGQQLTDKTLFTDFAQMIGTPLYMSPEQAELSSNDIDTRSDIYSLGVLLYELLTGSTPVSKEQLKQAAFDEIRRIIREDEPQKPSTRISTAEAAPSIAAQRHTEPAKLAKLVRGELDWIVMKALEKDRSRRYETASGFAKDVQRYLDDEQVQACPPSAWYRFRKFARRNKRPLASGAVVALMLLLAVGAVGWAVRDREARREEAANQDAARRTKLDEDLSQALKQVEDSVRRDRMPEALAAVQRAEWLLTNGPGSAEQQRRVQQWHTDLDRVSRLEEIRLQQADATIERESVDPGFEEVFRPHGLELANLDVNGAVEQIQASAVRDRLVVGLHDWARWDRLQGNSGWKDLLTIAGRVDPDHWRNQLREAVKNQDAEALKRLAADKDLLAQAPATLLLLAGCLSYPTDHIDLAVDVLRKAQKRHPDNIWINTNLGYNLQEQRPPHTDEAVEFFRAAVALRPHSPGAHVNLGNALARQRKWLEAEAEYREALALKQDYASAHLELGNVLRVENKTQEAEDEYREALRLEPDNGTARSQLVYLLSKLGRVSELEGPFREAIRRKPNDYRGHFWLGRVLSEQRKHVEAASEFRDALRLKPRDSSSQMGLGGALYDQRKWSEAEAILREVVQKSPNESEAHRLLAYSLSAQQKFAEEEAEWREYLRLVPDNDWAYGALGKSLSQQGKLAEAEEVLREDVRRRPDSVWAHYELGLTLFRQRGRQKLAEAEVAFREAIRIQPKNFGAHQLLGIVLTSKGDVPGAVAEFRTAIDIDPKNGHAYVQLGNALRTRGDLEDAVVAYRQAIDLLPNFGPPHLDLGHALKQKGDLAGAIDAYRKNLELDPQDANLTNHFTLAWELATCADPKLREPAEALKLVQTAAERGPGRVEIPKILGVAYYRAGDWKAAAPVLERAPSTDAMFFLAMAHWQLGEKEKARTCYDTAVAWLAGQEEKLGIQKESRRFRTEAAELLGIKSGGNDP